MRADLNADLKEAEKSRAEREQVAIANLRRIVESEGMSGIVKKVYPPDGFELLGKELGMLVDRKQEAYGDSIARSKQILGVLYPDGISTDQYADVLLVVRILDKLSRIATEKNAFGESPFRDIAGYGLLGVRESEAGE